MANNAIPERQRRWFFGLAGLILASLFTGIATRQWWLFGLPLLLMGAYLSLRDVRLPFYFLFACIPLSIPLFLPGGFSTDLPTEPLMIALTGMGLLLALHRAGQADLRFHLHPVTLLLMLHLGWIAITTITSQEPFISLKFLLAKIWYVLPFYFLAGWMLRTFRDVSTLFWVVLIPLVFTVLYVLVRHAGTGFTFATVGSVLHPFYSNHVIYAALMAVFFPWLWYMRLEYRHRPFWNALFWALIGLFLIAIYLSYTRAAYIAVISSLGAYALIRLRLVLPALALVLALALIGLGGLIRQNRYLELAPDYASTITHQDFGNLLEATYQGEDISTMERLYRWVAGFHMIGEKPWLGFGPGAFYESYRPYTVLSFITYVSDNKERSGIHSYYLMTLVEQGVPGLLFFLLFNAGVLITAQRLYHRRTGRRYRRLVLLLTLTFTSVMVLQIINDLIELDKVGAFFFLAAALLVNLDLDRMAVPEEQADN